MPDANDIASVLQRLESLEIKASFTEDLLDQLNLTIYRQQELLDRLTREVIQLRQQAPEGGSNGPRDLRDELPPHYSKRKTTAQIPFGPSLPFGLNLSKPCAALRHAQHERFCFLEADRHQARTARHAASASSAR